MVPAVKSLVDKITRTKEGRRRYQQEQAIMEFTEAVCAAMEWNNVTREELAKRLGKSKGYVTCLLDGRYNVTIRTIAGVFNALGLDVRVDWCFPQ